MNGWWAFVRKILWSLEYDSFAAIRASAEFWFLD